MGNLSHPSINRWGLNLFWYSFWFSDKSKSHNIHLDFFLNKLVINYINYGLIVERELFYSKYWYNKNTLFWKKRIEFFEKNLPIYYRHIEYKNKVNDELALVKLRIKKKNAHLTKLWILKFQNWIIINMYFIQPLKKRQFFLKKNNLNSSSNEVIILNNISKKINYKKILVRLFIFFKYLKTFQTKKINYYSF